MKKATLIIVDEDNLIFSPLFIYLTGETLSLGFCLLEKQNFYIIVDKRYEQKFSAKKGKILLHLQQIHKQIESLHILSSGISHIEVLKDLVIKRKIEQIQIPDTLSIFYQKNLANNLKTTKIIPVSNLYLSQRVIKNKTEIFNIQTAIKIIEKVFKDIEKMIKTGDIFGKTEAYISAYILKKIQDFGGEKESFYPIVAFGKNSAIPHHQSGKTKISDGPLLIDMGCTYRGYCSDFTRSFWIGKKNNLYVLYKQIHTLVQKAYKIGEISAKKGKLASHIDAQVRNLIQQNGYGENFIHGTGHGVGIQIHESPKIKSGDLGNIKLQKGMVFTIEPGVYLPNIFGIRLENIVFFDGVESKNISKIPFKTHLSTTNLVLPVTENLEKTDH